ncbi:hypothetical protein CVT26_003036 [Gymnopilus dilepis]|uniref:Uncharacterized protein n=1 Tax=Gymnopilus dilepis TaxID=231916 RepID=A0A409Y506_9AGAR|nr:hypothetical protein CVT26_003036 [Gymnopilus dilepis]
MEKALLLLVDHSDYPSSSSAQVLNNFDLLDLIFSSFLDSPQTPSSEEYPRIPAPHSQHLLWAALTCKAFFGPATSALWHSVDSWTSLLCLIPILKHDIKQNRYITTETILESHLARLSYYASLIRFLKVTTFDQFVSTHIYASINILCPNLFPKLSRLAIPNVGDLYLDNLNALFLLPASSLSSVSLGGIEPGSEVFVATLLIGLSKNARFLDHLSISGPISLVTFGLLSRFRALKSLDITGKNTVVDRDVMVAISAIQGLKKLSLTLGEGSSFTVPMEYRSGLKLEGLSLGWYPGIMYSILGILCLSQLKDIDFHCLPSELSVKSAEDLVQQALPAVQAGPLTSFSLNLAMGRTTPWQLLLPLRSCKLLTKLDISIDHLDASKLADLCGNGEWDSLSFLALTCHDIVPEGVGLSVHDLRLFAEHCPKLDFLAVSLEVLARDSDALRVLWKDGIADKPRSDSCRLQRLQIMSLASRPNEIIEEAKKKSVVDAVAFSQYLHNLFPLLDRLTYPGECDWFAGVEAMIRALRRVGRRYPITTMTSEDSDAVGRAITLDVSELEPPAVENNSTLMARTGVLENPDILEKIFSSFQQPATSESDDGESRSRVPFPVSNHLVLAALTQRSFFGPAMNVLWRSMNSLEAVLMLIPKLALALDGAYTTSGRGTITEADLVRLKLYAVRVRHFHFQSTSLKGVVSAEIIYILSKKLGGPLFPTLRTLECNDVGSIQVDRRQALFLFASPTLSDLSIRTNIYTPSPDVLFVTSLLEALVETAQGMTVLKVNGFSSSSALVFNLSEISKRHANSLKQLAIECLSLEAVLTTLSSLSVFTSLTVLSMTLSGSNLSTQDSHPGQKLKFPALEDLQISGGVKSLVYMSEIGMTCPSLNNLSINILQLGTDRAVQLQRKALWQRRVANVIHLALSLSPLLRSIQINSTDSRFIIPRHISKALSVLLTCTQLTEVDLYCAFIRGIHGTLCRLCAELSLLEVLKVSWSDDGDEVAEKHLSLVHLEDFAMPCPTLKVVHIPIFIADTSAEFEKMRSRITEKPLNHGLAELVIRPMKGQTPYSSTKNAGTVSRYIDHLFPSLQILSFRDEPRWTEDVDMMVKHYQDVRRWAKDLQPEIMIEATDSEDANGPYFSSLCTTAQFRTLHNQDILQTIFSHLFQLTSNQIGFASKRNRPPPQPNLLSAALTCKSFFNPAIRLMWNTTTLSTLLSIIPVFMKREETYTLEGFIEEEHLHRLDLYARQVRFLHIISEVFPAEIYAVISRLRHPLLPAITTLHFSSPDKTPLKNTASLLLAMSPTLSKVDIGSLATTPDVILPVFFQSLSVGTLQWLRLRGSLPNLVINQLPRFTRLSYLHLDVERTTGHDDIVGVCSHIPMLQKLRLGFETERRYPTSTATAFDSLETLILGAAGVLLVDLLGIFQHLRTPSLLSLLVEIWPGNRNTPHLQLSQSIDKCGQLAQSKSLQSLKVIVNIPLSVPWDAFTTLRRSNHLKSLDIGANALSVTNDDVSCFFEQEQWPELKTLAINFVNASSANATLTASVLGILARNYPRLTSIAISIHIRNDEDLYSILQEEMRRNKPPQSLVTRLQVSLVSSLQEGNVMSRKRFSVTGAGALAQYVNYCFPKLESIIVKAVHLNMPRLTPEVAEFEIDWAKGVQDIVRSYHELRRRSE